MENIAEGTCVHSETIMSDSSTATDSSSFHVTTFEESLPLVQENPVKDSSGASASGRSEYFSVRTETMMESRSKFSDEVEVQIEFSKSHWSEVSGHSALPNDEEEDRENMKVFEELMKHPEYGAFFRDWRGFWKLKLGRKIAEGGQAEIYETLVSQSPGLLLKVFKRGSLPQLRQLWSFRVLKRSALRQCVIHGGTMLDDGRFAFVMKRCRGDLRNCIDKAMQEKNNQGPPFPFVWEGKTIHAEDLMVEITSQMKTLHFNGIFYRDLKVSNILLDTYEGLIIADFECSIGVVGTTFWRAPEILLALKNKDAIIFSEKADIYSYSMTCFEIVTGRLPFEGELEPSRSNYDLIIEGRRPKLPNDLDVKVKEKITKCWALDSNQRLTFFQINYLLF